PHPARCADHLTRSTMRRCNMPIKRRASKAPPGAPGIGLGGSNGAMGTFGCDHVASIIKEVGHHSEIPSEQMAALLDSPLTMYLGHFGTGPNSAPSEKEEWAAILRTAAENCLAMLDPWWRGGQEKAPSIDYRAYSHLLSLFPASYDPTEFPLSLDSPSLR